MMNRYGTVLVNWIIAIGMIQDTYHCSRDDAVRIFVERMTADA